MIPNWHNTDVSIHFSYLETLNTKYYFIFSSTWCRNDKSFYLFALYFYLPSAVISWTLRIPGRLLCGWPHGAGAGGGWWGGGDESWHKWLVVRPTLQPRGWGLGAVYVPGTRVTATHCIFQLRWGQLGLGLFVSDITRLIRVLCCDITFRRLFIFFFRSALLFAVFYDECAFFMFAKSNLLELFCLFSLLCCYWWC